MQRETPTDLDQHLDLLRAGELNNVRAVITEGLGQRCCLVRSIAQFAQNRLGYRSQVAIAKGSSADRHSGRAESVHAALLVLGQEIACDHALQDAVDNRLGQVEFCCDSGDTELVAPLEKEEQYVCDAGGALGADR